MSELHSFKTLGGGFENVGVPQCHCKTYPNTPNKHPSAEFEKQPGAGGIDSTLEAEIKQELSQPTPVRMWAIAKAFEQGMGVEEVHELTSIWVRTRCW